MSVHEGLSSLSGSYSRPLPHSLTLWCLQLSGHVIYQAGSPALQQHALIQLVQTIHMACWHVDFGM